jgi:hypothetical protein
VKWREWVKPLADKIVYASDAYVGVKSTLNDLSSQIITFSQPHGDSRDSDLLRLVRSLIPEEADGLDMIRVGGAGDGGYVMRDSFEVAAALSFGVGRDISWDKDIASRGVPVHAFDHTVRGLPEDAPGVTFHRVGLGTHPGCLPLATHMQRTCPSGDVLLKVDIESGEWDALQDADLTRCSQVIVELHGLDKTLRNERSLRFLEELQRTHAPVHIHANNYDSVFRADRYWFAATVEATYVRRDMLRDWRRAASLREDLDRPCDPRVADISLAGVLTA